MPLLYIRPYTAGVEDGARPLSVYALPSGLLGVLCEGLVYPVRDAYYIELDRAAEYVSDCTPLLEISDDVAPGIISTPRHRRSLAGSTLRICFDGTEPLLGALVSLQSGLKLNLTGFGRSLPALEVEPALGGHTKSIETDRFDWFLDFGGPRLPSRMEIDNLFYEASRRAGEFAVPHGDSLALRSEIALRDQRVALLQELIEEQNEISATDAARITAQVDVLQAALSRYRTLFDDADRSRREFAKTVSLLAEQDRQTHSSVRHNVEGSPSEIEIALENWQQSETALANARAELAVASSELEKLKHDIATVQSTQIQIPNEKANLGSGRRRAREKDIEVTFRSLLPNICPIADSVSFLAGQVANLKPLLILLKRINDANKAELPSKKVRGADGWFECHFSTGQSDDGRLYFCWREGASGKGARVLISNKGRQPQDIERLAAE